MRSNPTRTRRALAAALLLLIATLTGCATYPDLSARIAERGAIDQSRDAGRKPAAVLEFLGIEEGMIVVDVLAAGGHYTEVLSAALGPLGKVYAHNIDFLLRMRGGINEKAIAARLAGDRLPNVERLDTEF